MTGGLDSRTTGRRAFGRKKPSGASSEKGVSPAHLHSGTRSSPRPPITPSPVLRSKLRLRAAACGTRPGANCRPPKMTKAAQGEPQASKQGEGEDVLGTFGEPQACLEALKRVGRGRQALFFFPPFLLAPPPPPSLPLLPLQAYFFKLDGSPNMAKNVTLILCFFQSVRTTNFLFLSTNERAPSSRDPPCFFPLPR